MFAIFLSGKTNVLLSLFFTLALADKDCGKSQCRGPVKYYEELRCKPVYAKPDDCCPVKYDCSHLESRTANKCYVNGKEYSVGDQLKDEDRTNPCDIGCRCVKDVNDVASFTCAIVDCFTGPVKAGCYRKRKPSDCCAGEEVCPAGYEERATCRANGKIYREGEYFVPEKKRNLSCTCMEGFTGEFVEPFCKKVSCGTEMRGSSQIYRKCIPVYYHTQSLMTDCNVSFRCQNDKDKIIKAAAVKSSDETSGEDKSDSDEQPSKNSDMKCTFGNMTLEIGDELNQATDYSSVCVKCVCEVPPTPTCQRLSDSECDVTKHPDFN